MTEGNGTSKLVFWLMSGLLTVLLIFIGGAATSFSGRVSSLENGSLSAILSVKDLQSDIRDLRRDVCRLERKVDDLTESVTHKKVYRLPCP